MDSKDTSPPAPSVASGILVDQYFRQLASNLGHEWLKLSTYLGFKSATIDRLQEDYHRAEECIFKMLVSWRQNSDWRQDNCLKLQAALVKCGRQDLADELQDIYLSGSFLQSVTLTDLSESNPENDCQPTQEHPDQGQEPDQHHRCLKRLNSVEHIKSLRAVFHRRFAHLRGMERLGSTCRLVDFVAGYFDFYGGTLGLPEYDVLLYVPQGAIPSGKVQEVYLYVNPMVQSVSGLRSRAILSPLVECGPSGLTFLKSVVLHLPHFATNGGAGWDITAGVSYSESEETHSGDWNNLSPDENNNLIINQQQIILALDHFSRYAIFGTPSSEGCSKTMKMYVCSPIKGPTEDVFRICVLIWNDTNISKQCVIRSQEALPFAALDEARCLEVTWRGGDLMLQLTNISPGFKVETSTRCITKEILWENQMHSVTFDLSFDPANHSRAKKMEGNRECLCDVDVYQSDCDSSRRSVHMSVHHGRVDESSVGAEDRQDKQKHQSKKKTGDGSQTGRMDFAGSLTKEESGSQMDSDSPWKFKASLDLGTRTSVDASHLLRGIAAYKTGEVVIADFANDRVVVCDTKSIVQDVIPLERVWDVAVLPHDYLVAVDETSEVKVFTEKRDVAFTFPTNPDKKQVGLVSVAIGPDSKIFIGDAATNVVTEHLPTDGALVGTRQLHACPHFMAVNSKGQLLVSSWNSCRVDIMGDGDAVMQTIHPCIHDKPAWCLGVCCNAKDDIFVVVTSSDDTLGHVHQYSSRGDFEQCVMQGLHKPRGVVCIDDTQLAITNDDAVLVLEKVDS
ncbi:uncharacterized protein LOC119725709 [Patiria miniata]|uniref:Netrin receptor UNC5 n=1 Tax=Patiria miniata TaxID=46514 RepID=A0A913ZPV7_PATMI|nr:uncharacterized protein LOC119725709 [Patiria miniata]